MWETTALGVPPCKSTRKSDGVDARMLARVGRLDPELLSPIRHRGEDAQRDLVLIRARHALITARTKLVSSGRGPVKSSGARLPKQAAKSLGSRTRDRIPEALREALAPMLLTIEFLTDEIATHDRKVEHLATKRYPRPLF